MPDKHAHLSGAMRAELLARSTADVRENASPQIHQTSRGCYSRRSARNAACNAGLEADARNRGDGRRIGYRPVLFGVAVHAV